MVGVLGAAFEPHEVTVHTAGFVDQLPLFLGEGQDHIGLPVLGDNLIVVEGKDACFLDGQRPVGRPE